MQNLAFKGLMALAVLSLTSVAQAELIIDVYRDVVPGQSRWVFSGSATYSQVNPGGIFAGGPLTNIVEWKGAGAEADYVKTGAYNNYTPSLISGSITLSVTPVGGGALTGTIDGLHIDHDNITSPTSGDDFGVSLAGGDIPLSPDALVSWSGTGIFAVDVAKLNEGTFTFQSYGEVSTNNPYGILPIKMTVPEPGSALLLLAGLAGLAGSARRRRA